MYSAGLAHVNQGRAQLEIAISVGPRLCESMTGPARLEICVSVGPRLCESMTGPAHPAIFPKFGANFLGTGVNHRIVCIVRGSLSRVVVYCAQACRMCVNNTICTSFGS